MRRIGWRGLRLCRWAVLVAWVALGAAPPCDAAEYQIGFTGVVAQSGSDPRTAWLDRNFVVGTPVVGSLSFAADFGPNLYAADPGNGRWEADSIGAPIVHSFDVAIGDYMATASFDPSAANPDNVHLYDEWCSTIICPIQDNFTIRVNVLGDVVDGYDPDYGQFGGYTEDHSVIENLEFPMPSEIPSFILEGGLNFLAFGGFNTVRWDITSTDIVLTPEPSTAALLTLGIAGLAVKKRSARSR